MLPKDSFSNLSHAQKICFLQQLISMAKVDKDFHFVEFKYLTEIAELMGISPSELDQILDKKPTHAMPSNLLERSRQLYRLAIMMMIDGKVTDKQFNLLKDFAMLLGLSPTAINQMLNAMSQNKGGMLLNEQLIDIFSVEVN